MPRCGWRGTEEDMGARSFAGVTSWAGCSKRGCQSRSTAIKMKNSPLPPLKGQGGEESLGPRTPWSSWGEAGMWVVTSAWPSVFQVYSIISVQLLVTVAIIAVFTFV